MQAPGYFLYLPPTPIKNRFILLEETTKTFFDVDAETPMLKNPKSWDSTGLSPKLLGGDLAIVIPNRLDDEHKAQLAAMGQGESWFRSVDFETGLLVSVVSREGNKIYADIKGQVNVCPFEEEILSWEKLADAMGDHLVGELRNGLLERLYANSSITEKVARSQAFKDMPAWYDDASAMDEELNHKFASGKIVEKGEVRWILTEEDSDDEEDSEVSGTVASL